MSTTGDLLNRGCIVNLGGMPPDGEGRTFIVTGLLRSGTSLVASILQQAGLYIGTEVNDIVYEDEEIARVLASRDAAALQRIIGERDANYRSWGFKQPMLCRDLDPGQLALFHNPHLIVTFRDIVSMSVRTSLSEYQEAMSALRNAMQDLDELVAFIDRNRCPSLLLSYEKALMLPGDFVDAVMQFCNIPRSAALRSRLIGMIEPNRSNYIAGARRRYEGLIERVIDGHLHGWCQLTQSAVPVPLEVLVDGEVRLRLLANGFRQDLRDARIGDGSHGFSIAVEALRAQPDAVIRVRVAGHGIELGNSGRRLAAFAVAATRP